MENRETIENIEKFMALVEKVDPELFEIKLSLLETKVDPNLIPALVRALSIVANGTGFGEISIQIRNRKVGLIKYTETSAVDSEILIKEK